MAAKASTTINRSEELITGYVDGTNPESLTLGLLFFFGGVDFLRDGSCFSIRWFMCRKQRPGAV